MASPDEATREGGRLFFRLHDLRHTTISITLDTCLHAIPAMQKEAAALIAGLAFWERRSSALLAVAPVCHATS